MLNNTNLTLFLALFCNGTQEKKRQAMNISPTCIPSCTYSSETTVSKKQYELVEHFCPFKYFKYKSFQHWHITVGSPFQLCKF